MVSDSKMEAPKPKYATVEKIALYVRQIFLALQAPVKSRFQPWRAKEDTSMMDSTGAMYWSGHSMRHFLPTVAAAVDATSTLVTQIKCSDASNG